MTPTRTLAALVASACLAGSALVTPASTASSAPSGAAGPEVRRAGTTGLRGTFDFDTQAFTPVWTEEADFGWVATGGDPGGHLYSRRRHPEGAEVGVVSPGSWAGDRRSLFGGAVSFDLRTSPGAEVFMSVALRTDDFADAIYARVPVDGEVRSWRRITLDVKERGDWYVPNDDGTRSGARKADFERVLGELEGIYLYAYVDTVGDVLYLDNVTAASRVSRTLTLRRSGQRLVGRLGPTGSACVRAQEVTVLRQRSGPDRAVGTARTTRSGEYELPAGRLGAGTYYATAAAGFVRGGGTCSAARSSRVRVS